MLLDTSTIKASEVTTEGGIHIGDKNAPIKIVEFMNLRCPFCKQWWEESAPVLDKYVSEGKVERIVKLFDKEKPSLKRGNVIHHHLDYTAGEKVKEDISYFLSRQDEWGNLEENDIVDYANLRRGLNKQTSEKEAEQVIAEAKRANVTLVPSVFIEDYIFDEHITNEELIEIIETKLNRGNNDQ